jgi:hypothetical protein
MIGKERLFMGVSSRGGRGKERGMGDEYDRSTLYMYENSTMKPTENF